MKRVSTLMITVFLFVIATIAVAQETAIQTQPSSDGKFEIGLTEVKQKNDVVSIKSVLKNISGSKQKITFCFQSAYLIDPKENKKHMPLKDTEGDTIGGPKDGGSGCPGGGLYREIENGQQAILWVKFPAPVSGASEIDFFFPDFLPFEGVVIQK